MRRTAVFKPEPPTLPGDVRDLFFDRETELDLAIDRLREEETDRVYSIQGARRSGKSHFARRLVQRAVDEEGLPYTPVVVNAHNRGSARAALAEIFFRFEGLITASKFVRDDQQRVAQDFLAQHRLVHLDKVEWSSEAQARLSLAGEQTHELSLGVPNVASGKATAKVGAQAEELARRNEKYAALTDRDVVTWLERAADLLYNLPERRKVLVLLDDLDLVDEEGREGSAASNALLERLRPLAEHPHVTVVATVRHDYADGRKNVFSRLAELGAMDEPTLREVYLRRLKTFYEGVAIFDDAALQLLLESAEGMVGLFLRNCNYVWERAGRDPKLPLGVDAIDAWASWQLRTWRDDPDYAEAVVMVEEAMRGPRPAAEITLPADLRRTALHLTLVRPVHGRPGVWAINPIFRGAIRRP